MFQRSYKCVHAEVNLINIILIILVDSENFWTDMFVTFQ